MNRVTEAELGGGREDHAMVNRRLSSDGKRRLNESVGKEKLPSLGDRYARGLKLSQADEG